MFIDVEDSEYPTPQQYRVECEYGTCLCTIYHNDTAKVMMIDSVFVHEESRGNGYGKLIISEAILFAQLKGVDSVELVVNDDNEIARNLYKKLGFIETNKKHCRMILNVK